MRCGLLSYAQPLSPAETRADIEFLKHKLDQLHPAVGFYTPREYYEQLYGSLFNQDYQRTAYRLQRILSHLLFGIIFTACIVLLT